jgi:hypothetical protein
VLIRHVPAFASRELPRDQPLWIGETDTHVVVRTGCWTFFLEIQKDVRFPRIDQVLPDAQATATRLSLDAVDATFLSQALERLPGADEQFSPVTLDCNGRIALRAKGVDQVKPTELILSRSRYTGASVRLKTNREYLARAIRLGFGAIEIVDAQTPIVCRDQHRVYGWQPLSHESALEPTDDVIRIESGSQTIPTAIPADEPPAPMRTIVSKSTTPTSESVPSNGTANAHVAAETAESTSLAALIQDAESLHATLADARTRAGKLIVALRRYRRRERLVASTLASLRELKLSEVPG